MSFPEFESKVGHPLTTFHPSCLQVNLGKLCNQACLHCHVDAGPKRTEIMTRETVDEVLEAVAYLNPESVDITGGAPEMNPHFRYFVESLKDLGTPQIIDRCNLTILLEPGFEWAADFLAKHRVEITASLPFYMEDNVDRQRGKGVFKKSIDALLMLNDLGYGEDLPLNLVYNPQGAYMPPDQVELQEIYRRYLKDHFSIRFNQLFTITNMPIARFKGFLKRSGNYERYMGKLISRFNHATLEGLMCRHLISVGWDGQLYDCDFNQMLQLPIQTDEPAHIRHIRDIATQGRTIIVGNHCYGCTAGSGSSCGGTLEDKNQPVAV